MKQKDINDILNLIKETESSEGKAILLILLRLSDTLDVNTEAVGQLTDSLDKHRSEFTQHLQAYEAELNKKKGAYGVVQKIVLPLLAILQSLVIALWGYFYSDYVKSMDKIQSLETKIIELTERRN